MTTVTNWAEKEDRAGGAQFTIGAEDTNAIITAIQVLDLDGKPLRKRVMLPFYFSSNAAGSAIATAASGAVAIANSTGLLIASVAKLAGYVVTNTSGQANISITEADGLTTHIVLVLPTGQLAVSGAITHAE